MEVDIKELYNLQAEHSRFKQAVRDWINIRMKSYTDQQYGKGEMTALLDSCEY